MGKNECIKFYKWAYYKGMKPVYGNDKLFIRVTNDPNDWPDNFKAITEDELYEKYLEENK